jgi:hypothetical protein
MWNRLLARMVRRALLPVYLADPEHERTALEAAERGIRYAAALIGYPALILCVGVAAAFGGFWLLSRPAPPPDAWRTSRELGTENAQLRVAYRGLLKERDALMGRVAELETLTTEPTSSPAAPPARTAPTAPTAPKAPSPKPAGGEKALVSVVTPSKSRWEKPLDREGVLSRPVTEVVRCADGRISPAGGCSEPPLASGPPAGEAQVLPPVRLRVSAQAPKNVVPPSAPRVLTPVREQAMAMNQQVAPDPPTAR